MPDRNTASDYVLGHTDAEHERLIRQAQRFAASTERFFRAAGIGEGQRVLELGSGVGDVAMLVARLVGPTGAVLGVERDARSIERARARVASAGLSNVSFTQSNIADIASEQRFDAAVGRFILMFLPDPVAVLRSTAGCLRPGAIVAFQEPCWAATLLLSAGFPLWSACASLTHDTIRRSGANTEMGLALHRVFQQAGLAAPALQMEVPLGSDATLVLAISDLLGSLLSHLRPGDAALAKLGDLDSLGSRLQAEVEAANGIVPGLGLVGAWSRTP